IDNPLSEVPTAGGSWKSRDSLPDKTNQRRTWLGRKAPLPHARKRLRDPSGGKIDPARASLRYPATARKLGRARGCARAAFASRDPGPDEIPSLVAHHPTWRAHWGRALPQ